MNSVSEVLRARDSAHRLVDKYELSLSGLTVLTEAASGPYLFNPLIAVVAGASRVIVHCRDSIHGKASVVYADMREAYREAGVTDGYEIAEVLDPGVIGAADIVTNSGHIRPLNTAFIKAMKPTGVISLMWEPWELRDGEIDLDEAKRRGILVLGTNEHEPPCDMKPYSPLLALKLMFDHGIGLVDDRILIMGGQYTLADAIVAGIQGLGLECRQLRVTADRARFERELQWASYLIVAEHAYQGPIIGEEAVLSTSMVADAGITGVGVIAGSIDVEELRGRGISVYPEHLQPPGYMSYQAYQLGPYSVMDLFAAGLKVGESMAGARLSGLSGFQAVECAMRESPAMNLEGEDAWL